MSVQSRGRRGGINLDLLRETYHWLDNYYISNGYTPTIKEVGIGLNLSYSGAFDRLEKLKARGWISRNGSKRGIILRGIKG